ncbi:MAG: deoxyribodipyrimidine photo-lyase, partial [Rhodoferax sp.]|nr:deoxyribodipyrimidine photo-lyase [Rhodoferax sp.]
VLGLARQLGVQAVFAAHDYEPQAQARDARIRGGLAAMGASLQTCKDHVVFEGREILTQGGTPYGVFTPYKNNWLSRVGSSALRDHDSRPYRARLAERPASDQREVPDLATLGFEASDLEALKIRPGASGARALLSDFSDRMDRYHETRDFPAVRGPSYLSVHLRFGTLSLRRAASLALQQQMHGNRGAATWLGELIWRDFYFQILANFPHVVERAFKPEYEAIQWETGAQADRWFEAWCQGRTGYPLVDAAMQQINRTGYMHNRLRMVAGSFLVKDLGIDWRRGEAYFAEKLIDFDLSANNGGWQWVSSSGCDAQPYFRIFNPISQSEKFDPTGRFIRRYLPELASLPDAALHAPWMARPLNLAQAGIRLGEDYPQPIVDHAQARERTLQRYAVVKRPASGR